MYKPTSFDKKQMQLQGGDSRQLSFKKPMLLSP